MRKVFPILLAAIMSGCMNCYVRAPWTDGRIERVYECSREVAALSVICAFPQMMSDSPSTSGSWCWANLFTVPFMGLPCAVDALCEGVVDTVCLPIDWPLAEARKEDK